MALYYSREHISCYNYSTAANRIFLVITAKAGEQLDRVLEEYTILAAVISGEIKVSCGVFQDQIISEKQMFLVPVKSKAEAIVLKDSEVLVCTFSKDIKLCSSFSIRQLHQELPDNFVPQFKILSFVPQVTTFFGLLVTCLKEGLGCIHYHQMKRDELFLYLRAYYDKRELAEFFAPVNSLKSGFREFVLATYPEIKDVKHFAEQANMSLSTFNRNFKDEFGEPASCWLKRNKAEIIRKEIQMSDLPLTEIAEKHGFSSSAYLATFCKQNFHKTPGELRAQFPHESDD